ncbi:hypothetical protein MAHJHV55_35070 [Mycobacterium avium subsp. hominissuis]
MKNVLGMTRTYAKINAVSSFFISALITQVAPIDDESRDAVTTRWVASGASRGVV